MQQGVLETDTVSRLERVNLGEGLIPAKDFGRMLHEIHDRESSSHTDFVKAFAAGKLTREQLKRWGMEWYHYNMWMCPVFLASLNNLRNASKDAYYTRCDNVEGEIGFKKWKAHPYLAADLPLALGATMDEIEAYVPLPTTIFYARSNKGLEPGLLGCASFLIEFDNQRCSTIIREALLTHYPDLDEDASRYFEVHMEADIEHSAEYIDVMIEMCHTREDQEQALRKGAHSLRERRVCWNGWMQLLN